MYPLRYLPTGHIFMDPDDDCDKVVDAMLDTEYNEEFCLAKDFEEDFIVRMMEAGFLIMSMELKTDDENDTGVPTDRFFILLPKLHLTRSVLLFPELHIKKNIRPLLCSYTLQVDADFDLIMDKCIGIHGEDWLTPPLVEIIRNLHQAAAEPEAVSSGKKLLPKPISFGLYRDGELKAGEFGILMGRTYTSYSGYFEEDNAGTVQMILMAQWMEKSGFDFLDFGMPMDYKNDLGARNIEPRSFVELFRKARYQLPRIQIAEQ